jgi:hypothetical protein
MGAVVVSQIPDVGGGAFGAARLAALRSRLQPQVGLRPGRPADKTWNLRRKVPMSAETLKKLQGLAAQISDGKRKVSPMQLAAQLLEQSLLPIKPVANKQAVRVSTKRQSASGKKAS